MKRRPTTSAITSLLMLASTGAMAQTDPLVQVAIDLVRSAGAGACSLLDPSEAPVKNLKPDIYHFKHKEVYDDTPRTYRLIRVPCWRGPYNQSDMYVLADQYDELTLLSFAVPAYNVKYKDPDELTTVESITMTGYTSKTMVMMSEFDPKRLELSEVYLGRGLGDAGTSAVWRFQENAFTLQSYDLDATYDGEINPSRLVEFGAAK